MTYQYSKFTVHPPDHPDQAVKVEAFDKRGAQLKARMVLLNMGEPDVKYDKLVVRETSCH